MKSYREIADSVFARRDQYVIAQRKKKQIVTRVTASVSSVALVSLASFALFRNDVFHDVPPVSTGDNNSTTVTNTPTEIGDTTTANNATATTTDGGIVNPTTTVTTNVAPSQTTTVITTGKTQPPTATTAPSKTQPPATTPSKTEPSQTTTTTAPKKVLITGSTPDDYGADNFGDEAPIFRYGEISPLLKEAMETNKDTNAVYAVMVAVCPRFDQAIVVDEMNKAVEEFKATDEMMQLAEEENWGTYEIRLYNFREEYRRSLAEKEVEALAELSETELFDLVADAYSKPSSEVSPIVIVLHMYSFRASYFYSTVLSADAIHELAERGSYMFWLDTPDTAKEMYNGYNCDEG